MWTLPGENLPQPIDSITSIRSPMRSPMSSKTSVRAYCHALVLAGENARQCMPNSYDCREPRHRPVDRQNWSAKFWLEPDVTLATNHGFSCRELRDIERIMREHLET